ncbi:hypothetical protein [Pseudomonas sp. RW10S2]|uniref:hypothetical protein n=1 Tax=Pseudomonas sp. RW10S2 TaxID=459637 RepID=UPI001648E14B|nr:hypothetical protein [Pseudomonas sp. RW10S2]MBC3465029.1 hypothetical protein [Pseudomonas sp. RW10S2]
MKAAISFLVLSVLFGYASLLPAAVIPKPYGLWVSIPLLFANTFAAFGLTMRINDGKLRSLADIAAALSDGKDLFLSWSIYMGSTTIIAGVIALLVRA